MTHRRTFLLAVGVGVLFLTAGVGTVAAQTGGAQDPVDTTQSDTGTIEVFTGDQGDNVEIVDSGGATVASGTTGANGEVDLTVDPANGPFDVLVNGNTVATTVVVNAGGTTTVDTTAGGAQDPVDANGNRIVGGPGGNSGTVFLGEDDIATNQGVFRNVAPGEFTDADDAIFTLSNGVVDQDNAISTYVANVDGRIRVLEVREPRIQNLFVIDALENERLDDESDTTIEPTQPGDGFNVQIAADYNYFESTSIDTTTDFLTRDGSDVTGIYIENTRDVSLDTGVPFRSVDGFGRTYDFLAEFNINDTGTGEYTVNADPRTGNERPDGRDVGFAGREGASDSLTYTVQQRQQQTGIVTVITANRSESVEAVNSQTGDVEDNGVTNQNGEADLTVPANTPVDILVNESLEATGVSVPAGGNTTVDVSGDTTPLPTDGLQDPVDANGNRIVGGPGGNSGTIFLGEDDISLTEGVFRGVAPGQFTDADDNVLVISNGIVGPSNAISTYTINFGGTTRTLNVREPRVQSLFVIDALENERLDGGGEPEINRSGPGDDFNVQVAADYNYFGSTSISLDEFLTRGGNEVTGIYFEESRDTALDAGGPFESVDENRRTYDFLAEFNITDTGEYTVNAAPASGDDRSDGRDVGFVDREDASDTESFRVAGDNLFTEPLPGFNDPPQNTQELNPTLYEDIDGDGDGTDPTQAVTLWTQLVLNPQDFDDLTQEQIDALDWNEDGQLTPADAVELWTEQVLAG